MIRGWQGAFVRASCVNGTAIPSPHKLCQMLKLIWGGGDYGRIKLGRWKIGLCGCEAAARAVCAVHPVQFRHYLWKRGTHDRLV